MTFMVIVKIILLIASIFFGVCSIGSNTKYTGDRCVALSAIMMAALMMLMICEMTRG